MHQATAIREPHEIINELPEPAARAALTRCCGAQRWVNGMLERRPFASLAALLSSADKVWSKLDRDDYMEAFSHHPQIGTDLNELARKFASTAQLSSAEQAGVAHADLATLTQLRDLNQLYAARFGFIFIVCASGKSAHELLSVLEDRLHNDEKRELAAAAGEQAKITQLRLQHLTP
ncbi:MAG: 2-oxo-4-hydroxy-4-carboxy-5-ureidoimidazoline decarboxylase [Polyangiales bacterium]